MSEDRIPRDQLFNTIARVVALRSTCPRAKVGAILVRDNRIVAQGYNGAPAGMAHCTEAGCIPGPDGGCLRVVHAEANLISFAAKNGGRGTQGTTLYTVMAPCLECAKLIINSGIKEVIYQIPYKNTAGLELLELAGVSTICLPGEEIVI